MSESLEVLPHGDERLDDVEVIHPDQLAPARVEEQQLSQREELEGAPKARARSARRLGDPAQLAELERVEVDETVALAEGAPADHDRGRPVDRHGYDVSRKPNSLSAFSSRRQLRRTFTVSSR